MHKLFESQLDNEQVYLVLRQHPILIAFRLGFVFILALVGIAAQVAIPYIIPYELNDTTSGIITLVFSVYYLVLLFGGLLVITFYYLSLQIITDMRMVDVDQHGLFGRRVTEIQIENVEEVTSHARGILPTLFSYGNVLVQTSGSVAEFEFDHIAHPEHVKKMILDLYEQRRKTHGAPAPHPAGTAAPTQPSAPMAPSQQ
jgi:uncharacterized membrane protein YdbT with pleckstrin-like domain